MLLGDVEIGVRDPGGQHEPIMVHAAAFPELPEPLGSKHFA